MSIEILTNSAANISARQEMRRRGLDFVSPRLLRILRKTRLISGVNIGDSYKSWDVLRTIEFLEHNTTRDTPILDIGAYSSEILCALTKLGFSSLTGIDLNPRLPHMPHAGTIKYVTGDFTATPFPDESFGAISAISVIEHGFCGPRILAEISRILQPGGYFVGSIDYWPMKIDTDGVTAFGLDWRIFSQAEVEDLVSGALGYGMLPVGNIKLEASEKTAKWLQREFTYAWFAFQKIGGAGPRD